MFLDVKYKEQSSKLDKLNLQITKIFGRVPPNFELIGNINENILEDFLSYIFKLMNHKSINPDYYAFLRLFIANQEGFEYCKEFNKQLLLSKNYDVEIINEVKKDISKIPFDDKHKLLANKSIKAIFDSKRFTQSDFDELYNHSWNDKDILDSIEHTGFMLRNGRILTAYTINWF